MGWKYVEDVTKEGVTRFTKNGIFFLIELEDTLQLLPPTY